MFGYLGIILKFMYFLWTVGRFFECPLDAHDIDSSLAWRFCLGERNFWAKICEFVLYPYHPCMVYLPTYEWLICLVHVGIDAIHGVKKPWEWEDCWKSTSHLCYSPVFQETFYKTKFGEVQDMMNWKSGVPLSKVSQKMVVEHLQDLTICCSLMGKRWASTSYIWGYNPYKWP